MSKQLVGKAPLSLVRTAGGTMEYVYARGPVPAGADRADVLRLLEEGFLEEVESVEVVPAVVVEVPVDPGLVNTGSGEVVRPPRAAAKDAWVEYAVSQGVDQAEAEAMKKQDLVERFMPTQASAPAEPSASESPAPESSTSSGV